VAENEGYKFTVMKIDGIAQNKGEELFIEYLRRLGVRIPLISLKRPLMNTKPSSFTLWTGSGKI